MSYVMPVLCGLLFTIAGLFAPLLVLLALPFAKWDKEPSLDSMGHGLVTRGDLPSWAWWLETPDERLPGGLYEPAVSEVFERYGRWVCSWYWLGVRNRMHGLAAHFCEIVDEPWPAEPGYYERDGLWWLRQPILGGRLQFKAGWRTYRVDGQWIAVPCCTVTKP